MKLEYDAPVDKGVSHLMYVGDDSGGGASSGVKILMTLGAVALLLSFIGRKRR